MNPLILDMKQLNKYILYSQILNIFLFTGVSSYRKAKSGKPLPNPRLISSKLYEDKAIEDPKLTLNAMQFGQLFAHDLGNRLVGEWKKKHFEAIEKNEISAIVIYSFPKWYGKLWIKDLFFRVQ